MPGQLVNAMSSSIVWPAQVRERGSARTNDSELSQNKPNPQTNDRNSGTTQRALRLNRAFDDSAARATAEPQLTFSSGVSGPTNDNCPRVEPAAQC
eukprot:1231484-Pyramimonas_sp.AAC.1